MKRKFQKGRKCTVGTRTTWPAWFELHGSTMHGVFFNKYYKCIFLFFKNYISFYLTYFAVRTQYILHIQNMCQSTLCYS